MSNLGMLWCTGPEPIQVPYIMEAMEDDPDARLVEIEVMVGDRCLMYLPRLVLYTNDGQRFDLTVIAYDVGPDVLRIQATGTLVEEERLLERAA
jgi:hypothetical protein